MKKYFYARIFLLVLGLLFLKSLSCANNIIYILTRFSSQELDGGLFKKDGLFGKSGFWAPLREEVFRRSGYTLKTPKKYSDDLSDAVYIICFNGYYEQNELYKYPKNKLILAVLEAPAILPHIHDKEYQARFGKIFTWEDALIDNKKYFKLLVPRKQRNMRMIDDVIDFDKKKLCVLVAGNKVLKHDARQLFSARREAVNFFESVGTGEFDLYGVGWDFSAYKNYKGPLGVWNGYASKIACIKHYKFYLCYENMCDITGYITEKIFQCFKAGVVPIYWGASNIQDYIPKECFVDRRDFGSFEEVYTFIRNMKKEEYQKYLDAIRSYLASKRSDLFDSTTFMEQMTQGIMA